MTRPSLPLMLGLALAVLAWVFTRSRAGTAAVVSAGESVRQAFDPLLGLLREFEGLRLAPYQDSGGVWHIGYGHKIAPGERFAPYGTVRLISTRDAEDLLHQDLARTFAPVQSALKRALTANQLAALQSLAYNVGGPAVASSTLLRLINAGELTAAAAQFPRWASARNAAGVLVELPGLVARRARERELFLS